MVIILLMIQCTKSSFPNACVGNLVALRCLRSLDLRHRHSEMTVFFVFYGVVITLLRILFFQLKEKTDAKT